MILRLFLYYMLIGGFFAIGTYIGSQEACPEYDEDDRLKFSLTAVFVWPVALWTLLKEWIEERKYFGKK